MSEGDREGEPPERGGITRRALLRDGTAVTVAVLAAGAGSPFGGGVAVAVEPRGPTFLTDAELRTLRAVVDVFIPADDVGGAVAGGCAEAIAALLGAFTVRPPRIYAGAPFSDRGGADVNRFERFLRLDRYEDRAWRLRVREWQEVYREGLAALGEDFADQPAPERERRLRAGGDAVSELTDVAWPHTWAFMYGAPEYGGNRDLLGWRIAVYDGDVLPRGWTRRQIEQPDRGDGAPLTRDVLEDLLGALGPAVALGASPEATGVMLERSGGTLAGLRRELAPLRRLAKEDPDGP